MPTKNELKVQLDKAKEQLSCLAREKRDMEKKIESMEDELVELQTAVEEANLTRGVSTTDDSEGISPRRRLRSSELGAGRSSEGL